MFALLLLQQGGRYLVLQALPIERTGTPTGSIINLSILAALIVGFALSLRTRVTAMPAGGATAEAR